MNIEKFLEIEHKYNLYDLLEEDVPFWLYNRFHLWNYDICAQQFNFDSQIVNRENLKIKENLFIAILKRVFYKLKRLLNVTKNILIPIRVPRNRDILFLNHERRIKNNNYYDCLYTEELSNFYSNSITLEGKFQGKHFTPVRTKNLLYTDSIEKKIDSYIILYNHFNYKNRKRIYRDIYEKILPILKELAIAYNWNYNDKSIAERLTDIVIRVKFAKKIYRKVIKKISPKVIVEVVHYDFNKMIINEIAKELNIPIIELQHGTMHEEHSAYQYYDKRPINVFPDFLLLFSNFWRNKIRVPISDNSVISVGFPFYESEIEKYEKNKRKDLRYTIIFVSQPTIGSSLSNLAIKLANKLPSNEYRIIYKLHPSEYGSVKKYENLLKSNIEVISSNDFSIYKYYAESDMLIGVYSTAIYEGLGFNLKTLIYKIGQCEVMKPLVEFGYAEYIDNVEGIIDIINNKNVTNNKQSLDFWEKDSFNNIVSIINQFL